MFQFRSEIRLLKNSFTANRVSVEIFIELYQKNKVFQCKKSFESPSHREFNKNLKFHKEF